jgi:hypothetical protein
LERKETENEKTNTLGRVTDFGHVFPLLVDFVVELMTLKVASCIYHRVFEVAGGFSTFFALDVSYCFKTVDFVCGTLLFCFGH